MNDRRSAFLGGFGPAALERIAEHRLVGDAYRVAPSFDQNGRILLRSSGASPKVMA
jgi:hypothetical protein